MNRCDLIILGQLFSNDQHGYEIKSFVEERELNRWANISVSSIYHRLGWLADHGYIKNKASSAGKPQRNEYRLTSKGKERLYEQVQQFISGFNDDPRTLGLAFLHVLPTDLAISQLNSHIELLQEDIRHLKRIVRRDKANTSLSPLSPLLNNMSLDHLRVELKYMKAVLEVLSDPASAARVNSFFAINE